MTEIRDRDNKRKQVLEALLAHLTDRHTDALAAVCAELNYEVSELAPKPISEFTSPGTSSEIQQLRWQHFEERRVTKVTAVALEVAAKCRQEDEKLSKLLKFFGLAKPSHNPSVSESSTYEGLSPLQRKE